MRRATFARTPAVWCVLFTLCLFAMDAAPALAGESHRTSVTFDLFNFGGSLVATGRVRAAYGTQACQAHRAVLIQKRGDGGGWQTVESRSSALNGIYRVTLSDVDGAYRAFVKKLELGGTQGTCASAVSRVVTHGGPNCTPGYCPCLASTTVEWTMTVTAARATPLTTQCLESPARWSDTQEAEGLRTRHPYARQSDPRRDRGPRRGGPR